MPHRHQLPMEAITGRPCFVTEMQSGVALLQSRDHTTHGSGISVDLTQEPYFPLSAIFGQGDGMPCLGDIESNENCCILSHGSSSRAEARLAQCEQPSLTRAVWDESPHSWTGIRSYRPDHARVRDLRCSHGKSGTTQIHFHACSIQRWGLRR